jgi:hypothetical protein
MAQDGDFNALPRKPQRKKALSKAHIKEALEQEQASSQEVIPPMEVDSLGIMPIKTPKAFDPTLFPEGTFVAEPWDKFLPKGGFISDLTYALKGTETNTGFSIWTAVWAISTLLARDAWLKWFMRPLIPNFYVFLIAPPAICKKSFSAITASMLLQRVPDYFAARGDHLLAFKKNIAVLEERATTESLDILLTPEEKPFVIRTAESSRLLTIKKPPQFAICADELTTFLGGASYNVGLIDRLTKLYDCKDSSSVTIGRGSKKFRDVFISMIGATTPDGIKYSMPENAFGGGFLSRVITVYSDIPFRIFPEPTQLAGTPSEDDLVERLAWIAENCAGEYYFSEAAREYFKNWYIEWRTNMLDGRMSDNRYIDARFDINLRKLAMIIRCQRYAPGKEISLQDVIDAQKILNYTFAFSKQAFEEVEAVPSRNLSVIKRRFQRYGKTLRADLVHFASGMKIPVTDLDPILWQLSQEALIKCELDGKDQFRPGNCSREVYTWIGSEASKEGTP